MARSVIGTIELYVGDKRVKVDEALFDTGATKSYVSLRLAEPIGYTKYEKPQKVLLAVENMEALAVGDLTAKVVVNGCELPLRHIFGVVERLRRDVVVGMDIMEPYEITLNVKEGRVEFKKYPPTLEIT